MVQRLMRKLTRQVSMMHGPRGNAMNIRANFQMLGQSCLPVAASLIIEAFYEARCTESSVRSNTQFSHVLETHCTPKLEIGEVTTNELPFLHVWNALPEIVDRSFEKQHHGRKCVTAK